MASVGSGYDLSSSTYSPDGRVFQVEYALKPSDTALNTCIGIKTRTGVVLATDRPVTNVMLTKTSASNRLMQKIDTHCGLLCSGLIADGKALANRAREEASNLREQVGDKPQVKQIADRLGGFLQAYTLYSSVRPFGVNSLLSGVDNNGPWLYMLEPSGAFLGYKSIAVGKGKQMAKTELEKLNNQELTTREAMYELAHIILLCHDQNKEKPFELEMSWCDPTETSGKHQSIPQELIDEAQKAARERIDAAAEEMEE